MATSIRVCCGLNLPYVTRDSAEPVAEMPSSGPQTRLSNPANACYLLRMNWQTTWPSRAQGELLHVLARMAAERPRAPATRMAGRGAIRSCSWAGLPWDPPPDEIWPLRGGITRA